MHNGPLPVAVSMYSIVRMLFGFCLKCRVHEAFSSALVVYLGSLYFPPRAPYLRICQALDIKTFRHGLFEVAQYP